MNSFASPHWLVLFGIIPLLSLMPDRSPASEPALTLYNQGFGVVREKIALELGEGTTTVRFNDITVHLEPESVILRDPTGSAQLRILEQSFRNDPVAPEKLLTQFEGQELDFFVRGINGKPDRTVRGRIVRAPYTPHQSGAMQRYGQRYAMAQMATAGASAQPLVELDGMLRFGLPGEPLFPALADDAILKPELTWVLDSDRSGEVAAELAYVTGGMSWKADYNLVSPEDSDSIDLIGWVTMDNQSGRTFPEARIKLMAGDVSKIEDDEPGEMVFSRSSMVDSRRNEQVTEKAFDEFHLYTLGRRITLRDRETKQVEFVRAEGVPSRRFYVYRGQPNIWQIMRSYNPNVLRTNPDVVAGEPNTKVWTMREFDNTEANGLGIPLPKGRLRFYKRDSDGQLEFTGENEIDHTPREETVEVYIGNAFDIVGERTRTNFKVDTSNQWADESFEIRIRNRKTEAVEVRISEPLYRWVNWEIRSNSDPFEKIDAQEIEFRVKAEPDVEKIVTYTVHYSW